MKRILITGSNGYIARNLTKLLRNYNLVNTDRQSLDLLNSSMVDNFFENNFFDVILNTVVTGGSRLKEDEDQVLVKNIVMHNNIMRNKKSFHKIINFGSGAELDRLNQINEHSLLEHSYPQDYYGLSKNIIAKLEKNNSDFYNVRIFNVFNYDELPTRMIKSNIVNYINNKDILIHQDKFMDFFFIDDLYRIIVQIIEDENMPNLINCSYKKKFSLLQIAQLINRLSDYEVGIKIQDSTKMGNSYLGKYNLPESLKLIGFEEGLKRTYKLLKEI